MDTPTTPTTSAKLAKILRFLIAGGIGAGVNVGVLYLLTGVLGVWYIASAVVAFIVSYGLSFVLQKFWTFQDASRERMHVQAGWYIAIALLNLGLNTGILYLFVHYGHIEYLIAQLITSLVIAGESFWAYRAVFGAKHVTG